MTGLWKNKIIELNQSLDFETHQ